MEQARQYMGAALAPDGSKYFRLFVRGDIGLVELDCILKMLELQRDLIAEEIADE